jgi:hypothetical protein
MGTIWRRVSWPGGHGYQRRRLRHEASLPTWGFTPAHLTHAQDLKTKTMLDAWDTMLCTTATANGFGCADIYHAFNGPAGTKAADGLLGPDYTHPSQRGNNTIESVLEALGYAPLA